MRSLARVRFVAILTAALLTLVACGDDGSTTEQTSPPDAQETTSPGRDDQQDSTEGATQDVTPAAPDASEALAGTFTGELPAGEQGDVTIIAQGPVSQNGSAVPFVVRNMTGDTISRVEVSGSATSNGKTVATGRSQSVHPNAVEPGHIAFGFVFLETMDVPEDATFDLTVDYEQGVGEFENIIHAVPQDVSSTGDSIVGEISNPHDGLMEGPIDVAAACFSKQGDLLGVVSDFADRDRLPAGETASFSIQLFNQDCPQFLVGASGFEPME